MNIYGKLQKARVELHSMELKKSGKNKFAGYEYFELSDFLPEIQTIFNNVGLCGALDFSDPESAKLHIFDTEKDGNPITFSTPVADAGLKGCTPIQQIGAMNTYLTRYLWVQAMCIVENDIVDSVEPAKKTETPPDYAEQAFKDAILACNSFREFLDLWSNGDPELKQRFNVQSSYKAKFKAFSKLHIIDGCTNEFELTKFVTGKLTEEEQDAYNAKLDSFRGLGQREI